jgi:23S rRNA (adenine2503-C2)-methyltransferase
MSKKHILNLTKEEIQQFVLTNNEKLFCVGQILDWVYNKKVKSFSSFTNISKKLREKLENNYTLTVLDLVSKDVSKKDGTIRFNFKTTDNYLVPTVFLPQKGRNVVCISVQIGCNIGCYFCNSGKTKIVRNLSKGEILEQVINVINLTKENVNGILFMGMGEPLLNYENVIESIKVLIDKKMFGIGRRHITVSTVGIVPKIYDFSDEKLGVRLAISLHSPNNEIRKKLVPYVRYDIEEILKAGIYYMTKNDTDLTIEYVLIKGVNDSLEVITELIMLLNKLKIDKTRTKINLIPHNSVGGKDFSPPEKFVVLKIQSLLKKNGYLTFVRESRGSDINASCGQLGY